MFLIYRLLLPFVLLAALPGWLLKTLKRGGWGTPLGERFGRFREKNEPTGATHIHAVSVGETILALKLIRAWLVRDPQQRFVLAVSTATGYAVAASAGISQVRVAYAPFDLGGFVGRYLYHFRPSQIVLIEGDLWPNLLMLCCKRNIPVSLVNARISPRSARHYRKYAEHIRPLFSLLNAVAIQEKEDAEIWQFLGVCPSRIHLSGSLKFDPNGLRPEKRPGFQTMLDAFGKNRPVILAASTHPGEEALIATAIHQAVPQALPVIVPRHIERRSQAIADLRNAGLNVICRSEFSLPEDLAAPHVFLIDSTGELRDWTAHATVAIIGKTFLATGGQNPCEAILAGIPVIFGPHMENFEPLASQLAEAHGCLELSGPEGLPAAIQCALDPEISANLSENATAILFRHEGATERIIDLLSCRADSDS